MHKFVLTLLSLLVAVQVISAKVPDDPLPEALATSTLPTRAHKPILSMADTFDDDSDLRRSFLNIYTAVEDGTLSPEMVHERIGTFLKEHGSQLSLAQRSKLHMLQILLSKKGASRRLIAYVAAAAVLTLAAVGVVVISRKKSGSTNDSPEFPAGKDKKLLRSVKTYARPVIGVVAQRMYAPDRDDVVLRGVSDEQMTALGGQEWVNQQVDERIAAGTAPAELTTDAFNALGGEQQGFILALNALDTAKIDAQVKEVRKIKEVQEKLSVSREARRSARKPFADLKVDVDHAIKKSENREYIDKKAYNARALPLGEMFSGKEPFVLSKGQLPAVVKEIEELSQLAQQLGKTSERLRVKDVLSIPHKVQPGDVVPQVADCQRRVAERLAELGDARRLAQEQIAKRETDAQAEKERQVEWERLAEERRAKEAQDKAEGRAQWLKEHHQHLDNVRAHKDLYTLSKQNFEEPYFRLGFTDEQVAACRNEFDDAKAARLAALRQARDEENERLRKKEEAKAQKRAALIAKQKPWREGHAKSLHELGRVDTVYGEEFKQPDSLYGFTRDEVKAFQKEFERAKEQRKAQLDAQREYGNSVTHPLSNMTNEQLDVAAGKDLTPPSWRRLDMTEQEMDKLAQRYATAIQSRRNTIERERMRDLRNAYVKRITAGIPRMSNEDLDGLVFRDPPTDYGFKDSDIEDMRSRFDWVVKDRRRALEVERLKAGGFDEQGVATDAYFAQKDRLHSLVKDPVFFYQSRRSGGKDGFGVRDLFIQLYNFAHNDGGLPWPDGHSFSGAPSTSNIDAEVLKEVRNKVKDDLGNWQEHVRGEIHRHWGNITFYIDDYCEIYKDSDFDLSTDRVNRAIERHLEAVKRSGLGGWAFDDKMFNSSKVYPLVYGGGEDGAIAKSVGNFAQKKIPGIVKERYQEFMKDYPLLAPAGK